MVWNFRGMALAGLCFALGGGCPGSQFFFSGEGDGDAAIFCCGMLVGAAVAHNWFLAAVPDKLEDKTLVVGGPGLQGQIAVVAGISSVSCSVSRRESKRKRVRETGRRLLRGTCEKGLEWANRAWCCFSRCTPSFACREHLRESGLECKAIPTPRHLSSDCGTALRFPWRAAKPRWKRRFPGWIWRSIPSTHESNESGFRPTIVYLDHAATSWPKPPEVCEHMVRALTGLTANAGRSGHGPSMESAPDRV